MNGDARTFWRTTKLTLLAAATGMLCGCVALPKIEPGASAGIDSRSTAAGRVADEIRTPGPWPTFAGIPQAPTDVRDAEAWRAAVAEQQADGLYVQRNAAQSTWSLSATEAFAAAARAEANPLGLQAPTAAEMAESEAYARALRKRATPPSSPR
ncbi:MAG: hypothetical protein Q8L66_09215 [Caulobacter sp.]|nr:hypothetical protein [Caulobacter sp.]